MFNEFASRLMKPSQPGRAGCRWPPPLVALRRLLRGTYRRLRGAVAWLTECTTLWAHRLRGGRVVHLLHIGKTGSTAVKHALGDHRRVRGCIVCLHPHVVTLADLPRGDGVVFFLRDPLSRFVSGFYSRQRQGQPRYHAPWSSAEARAFERFATPGALARALSSIDNDERAAAEQAMDEIAHVRDHFSRWLGDEAQLWQRASDILMIGFQETLPGDFERFKAKLGLPAELMLPDDDVLAHRNPTPLAEPLDDLATTNLKRWYAADYRLLDVCKQIDAQSRRAV